MATLKQIFRKQRKQHYHKYGDTIPYNPINGVKEWLQQKQTERAKHIAAYYILKELLEELEQWKKQPLNQKNSKNQRKPYVKPVSTATENGSS